MGFDELFRIYPFLNTSHDPRGCAFIIRRFVSKNDISRLKDMGFKEELEALIQELKKDVQAFKLKDGNKEYYYKLGLERDFLELIRFAFKIDKLSLNDALKIKEIVLKRVETL